MSFGVLGSSLGCASHALPETRIPSFFEFESPLDLRAAVHVHTNASSDANGSIDDIVEAAKSVGIDVVIITDHDNRDQREHEGWHGSVLVLVGEEKGGGGHILGIGHQQDFYHRVPRTELVEKIHGDGGLAFTAHPLLEDDRDTLDEELRVVDGMEVYSLSTDTLEENFVGLLFKSLFGLTLAPRTTVASIIDPPHGELALWDQTLAQRDCVGIGAVDSHGTYGFSHELAFSVVQTHLLVDAPTKEGVMNALHSGRCYISFEYIKPVASFLFEVVHEELTLTMGESAPFREGLEARVFLPDKALIKLIHDGETILEHEGETLNCSLVEPGVYRIEAWIGDRLWILSNPIRLRA